MIVRPDTLVRWHRDLYRLFWRVKSRPHGQPRRSMASYDANVNDLPLDVDLARHRPMMFLKLG